ncbi:hypothetical protein L596_013299 [Steinernema carpocapsae]|uniref:Uncharacterized protein n=1 Tax=Steinernema carpocapsae TaxID=34508 RepID=A0A4V6A518_STECR|nr:hypothetical protein L596_013299 [Steinernema carpocapsae]
MRLQPHAAKGRWTEAAKMPTTLQVNPEDKADAPLTVKDMRKKGQPWIIAAVALMLLLLFAFAVFCHQRV